MNAALTLEHPWLLALGLLVPAYVFFRIRLLVGRAVPYPPLQFHQPGILRRLAFYLPISLEALILLVLVTVAAGPYSAHQRSSVAEEGVDVALCLDVSATMQAADFPPNRLEALKELSSDFVKRGGMNRIAVYAFAKHVFTQSPLSTDQTATLEMIDSLSYKLIDHSISGGTAIGDALLAAAEGLRRYRIPGRDQALLLVTDGENNWGIEPLTAAKVVAENGIRLYVIGIGGPAKVTVYIDGKPFINTEGEILTTSLDDRQLKAIAATARGDYFNARSLGVLADIFDSIGRLERTPLETGAVSLKRSFRPELGLLALLLFGLLLLLEGAWLRRPFR